MAKAYRMPRVRAFAEWNVFTERLRRESAIQFYNYEIANGAVGGEARDDSGPAWGSFCVPIVKGKRVSGFQTCSLLYVWIDRTSSRWRVCEVTRRFRFWVNGWWSGFWGFSKVSFAFINILNISRFRLVRKFRMFLFLSLFQNDIKIGRLKNTCFDNRNFTVR